MQKRQRGPCVCSVLPVGTPTRDRGLGAPTKSIVRLMQGAPGLVFPPYFQVEQLSQVIAEGRNERGVLPERTGCANCGNYQHCRLAAAPFSCCPRTLPRL